MKQRISRLPSPALAGVIKEKSVPAAIAAIRNCRYDGATMVDLHLSCLRSADRESLEKISNSAGLVEEFVSELKNQPSMLIYGKEPQKEDWIDEE